MCCNPVRAKYLSLLSGILLCAAVYGQNMVPNPSFEQYRACPSGIMLYGINFDTTVINWRSGGISADYYNACAAQGSGVSVPQNLYGLRPAHSGDAYSGIYLYDYYMSAGLLNREYVTCYLQQPMQAGRQYSVSFYIRLEEKMTAVNLLATDQVGVAFEVIQSNPTALPYSVYMPGHFISDTTGWVRFHAVYTAAGGEQFMTIGNFYQGAYPNAAAYQVIRSSSAVPLRHSAYVYIDDVCVFDLSDAAMTTGTSTDTAICGGSPLVLHTPAGGTEPKWSTGAVSDSIQVTASGVYWVKTAAICGFTVDTFHVTVIPPVRLDIGRDQAYCYGTEVLLEAAGSYEHYLWNTGDTTPSLRVNSTGQYVLTTRDVCGEQSDTINVTILPEVPRPQVSDTTVCQYGPAPALPVSGAAIRWYAGNESVFTRTQPELPMDRPGIYTWYVTQTQGACESARQPVSVRVADQPDVRLGADTAICEGAQLVIATPSQPLNYTWNTGDTSCCITVSAAGVYSLHARNMCGEASDSVRVDINRCDQCVWFPSAFTPNNDSRNDIFRPLVFCPLEYYRLTIADRWGRVVFFSPDHAAGWDGMWKGMPVPAGTYFYYAEALPAIPGADNTILKGDVTVIR